MSRGYDKAFDAVGNEASRGGAASALHPVLGVLHMPMILNRFGGWLNNPKHFVVFLEIGVTTISAEIELHARAASGATDTLAPPGDYALSASLPGAVSVRAALQLLTLLN